VFLSEVLAGEQIGLGALDERYYMVYFGPVELGLLDTWKLRVRPINGRWAEVRPEDRAALGQG
jgi:hypothetical protein